MIDRTGTLTHRELRVADPFVQPRVAKAEAVALAAKLGASSEHPVSRALTRCAVASKVAAQVGIDTVVSQALPHDKLDYVMQEMAAGRHPLVVGDGLNDVLAIKAGATSIAMGERGIDIAVASADIVLLGDDLRRVPTCIRLGRRCRRTTTFNAAIGLFWTVAIIALAALSLLEAVWVAILHNIGTVHRDRECWPLAAHRRRPGLAANA